MKQINFSNQKKSGLKILCCVFSLFPCFFLEANPPSERKLVKVASRCELIEFAEADDRLDSALSERFTGEYESVLFIKGRLVLEGDFLEAIAELDDSEPDLIVIDGDLDVNGRIALPDATPGLFVSGETRALTLEGGECEIYIREGTFEYLVYGFGNEGILKTGRIKTPWVINEGHELRVMVRDAIKVDNDGDAENYDYNSENIEDSFVDEVLDGNKLDMEAFLERLMDGDPVLKDEDD